MANATRTRGRSAVAERPQAEIESGAHEYEEIEKGPEFQELIRAKRSFIIPAMAIFLIYYFLMLILVNYAPDLMKTQVLGAVNLAYLMALSQFFLAWIIAFAYLRTANTKFDGLVTRIVEKVRLQRESTPTVTRTVAPKTRKGGR